MIFKSLEKKKLKKNLKHTFQFRSCFFDTPDMLRKSGSLSIFCRLLVRTVVFGRVTYLVLAIVDFKVV